MGRFEPIVIEPDDGHYAIRQGPDSLLRVPADLFEAFETDAVFPPQWTSKTAAGAKPGPRYMLWHPESGELLMSGIEQRPPLLAEVFGTHPFRSYLQMFWLPENSCLVLRVFWNPERPSDAFDEAARRESFRVQKKFLDIALRLKPPEKIKVTLNAVDRYMRLAGLDGIGREADLSRIFTTHLTPPPKLAASGADEALKTLLTAMAGRAYPTITIDRFKTVDAMSQSDIDEVKIKLGELGFQTGDNQYRSH